MQFLRHTPRLRLWINAWFSSFLQLWNKKAVWCSVQDIHSQLLACKEQTSSQRYIWCCQAKKKWAQNVTKKKKSVKLRCRKAWVGVVRRCCVSHMDKSLCGLSRPRMWLRNVQEIHHKDKIIQRMTSLKKRQPYRFSHSCVHNGSEVHAKFRLFLNAIYSAPNKYYYIIE